MYERKHAIIGAGFCGLGVAAAFERHGIAYDVLEADDDLGGNWYHGVYETVHIISSKRTTQYGDYPMPAEYPDFPSAAQMLAYLNAYADHQGLRPKIEFRTRVARIAPADREGGRWALELESGERRVYGGVVLANGHHWDCRWPEYPGTFTGELIHSKQYRNAEPLKGKRVLVIGGGNSACDIAVEAARFAEASHISMRRGYWFLPKTMFGTPLVEFIKPWLPVWVQRLFLRAMLRIIVGRYEAYGLQRPDHRIFEKHPTVNSELLHAIKHGRITPHPDIARWDGRVVEFVDGVREAFDLVVAATGYHISFPELEPGVVEFDGGMPRLVGGMLPLRHRNLYVFGTAQVRYGAGPLITEGAEMLCALIEAQPRLTRPVGAVMKRLGAEIPRTNLVDPHRSMRTSRTGRRLARWLPRLEPLLFRG